MAEVEPTKKKTPEIINCAPEDLRKSFNDKMSTSGDRSIVLQYVATDKFVMRMADNSAMMSRAEDASDGPGTTGCRL